MENLEEKFNQLKSEWETETWHLSSVEAIVNHPAYQKIIGLGKDVVPLLLKDLENQLQHWFYALTILTKENPVPQEYAGNMEKIRQCWLEWGKKKGYL
jgi:hypothetical protein